MENIKRDLYIFGTSYCRGLHTINALLNCSKGFGKNSRYTQNVMKDPVLSPRESWSLTVQVNSFLRTKSAARLCQQEKILHIRVTSITLTQWFLIIIMQVTEVLFPQSVEPKSGRTFRPQKDVTGEDFRRKLTVKN